MNDKITSTIQTFASENITSERKEILVPVIIYLREKVLKGETIRLNFICTHNSRRSHLSQIWAQTMAQYFGVKNVFCYSGGTEATAMFPKVTETLTQQGFDIYSLSPMPNPVYAVKYDKQCPPIICFSKEYNHPFNPGSGYIAVLTCNSADVACPVVIGADKRFAVKYEDPKLFDNTDLMDSKYAERSLQIGQEMWYIFKELCS